MHTACMKALVGGCCRRLEIRIDERSARTVRMRACFLLMLDGQ